MKLTEKDILQGLKDLRLTEQERALMRSELSAYADLHSMPSVEATPFNSLAFLGNIFAHSRVLVAGTLAFVLVITGSSATALAAEKAVPGDVLYGVKVLVNEPVAEVFAGAGAGRARHHAKLAVRRVEEAEVLESRGALTSERAVELAERFVQEAEKAETEVAHLESRGDVSASLAIRTELATDLSLHVEEPATESVMALAKSAAAPTLVNAAAEPAAVTAGDEKVAFRTLVAARVASLRERHTAPPAFVVEDEEDDEATADEDRATAQVQSAKRALLSGSSVGSVIDSASTTASSSPLEGKRLLKNLLRARQNSTEGVGGVEAKRKDKVHNIEPSFIIESIENPARLVPSSAIPGE